MAPVSVITGGAGGIARATASRLIDRGPILLADLSQAALDAAAAELRDRGADVHVALCDVSSTASVSDLADHAASLGELGALVHTAGLAPPGATDPAAVFNVNAGGTARLLASFLPRASSATVAVCVASTAGHRRFLGEWDDILADPLDPTVYERLVAEGGVRDDVLRSYSLSKRSVILQVRRDAAAWGAVGARLMSVSPGLVVDTTIGAGASTIHAGAYATQSALSRAGYAADVAGVVAFLTSADAAYVTGTDLLVDGGVVAYMKEHAPVETREIWETANYA